MVQRSRNRYSAKIDMHAWRNRRLAAAVSLSLACGVIDSARATEWTVVQRARSSGLAAFVVAPAGQEMVPLASDASPEAVSQAFLQRYGTLFGVADAEQQLRLNAGRTHTDTLGHTHTTHVQEHRGIPVFSGMLKVHQDAQRRVTASNGHFFIIPDKLNLVPVILGDAAVRIAQGTLGMAAAVELVELTIVDPGWYGDTARGAALAWYVILREDELGLREAFFVDAHDGAMIDQWSLLTDLKFRQVYNGNNGSAIPGNLLRTEGGPPVPGGTADVVDANFVYDHAGDFYDYFQRGFGRDSIDALGMNIILTVNSRAFQQCPNARWNGGQAIFCLGTARDDVTAHELMHGVTQFTANLIYQNQSGQLNESFSDVFGELVDLYNGNASTAGTPGGTPWPKPANYSGQGKDTPNNLRNDQACSLGPGFADGVRWLIAEDVTVFTEPIRDMWNPPCKNHPSSANSSLQTCNPGDNGGVHSGSGVPNHAFAMLTDGKVFNGQTVAGIGAIKAGAVWYRALTTYLTPASDFADAYVAFNQAAQDLVGSTPLDPRTGLPSGSMFTAFDAEQVDRALLAVEMNTDGSCGATVPVLDPTPPDYCEGRLVHYFEDFENGSVGWTVMNSSPPTPYDWELRTNLPGSRAGAAWFCADPNIGNCTTANETGTHRLFSPGIAIPVGVVDPKLAFTHYVSTETGYDGGNLRISVDDGQTWQSVPSTAFTFNPYNTTLRSTAAGNTNPLAGQSAFSGTGGGWGTSVVDLSLFVSGGESVRFQFAFGKDGCSGVEGWYVDDLELFSCGCFTSGACDDGRYCNGVEACVGGFCQTGTPPCDGDFCDEAADACVPAVFWDDFENGDVRGWSLQAPGTTAAAGHWEIGPPQAMFEVGEPTQPGNAFLGLACAFTGSNSSSENGDVDDGVVVLLSPRFDLGTAYEAELSLARWYFNGSTGQDPEDFFAIEVSGDDGSSWFEVERLNHTQSANQWTARTFRLHELVALTDTMRIRVRLGDGPAVDGISEAAVDDVVVTASGSCNDGLDCDDGNDCSFDLCLFGDCVHVPQPCLSLVGSDPPSGAIDARQPHDLNDAHAEQGFTEVKMVFAGGSVADLTPGDFVVSQSGATGSAPTIVSVEPTTADSVMLTFDRPVTSGVWTTVDHPDSGGRVCLGFLPGDANGNGTSTAADILALIDSLNQVPGRIRPDYATDINRSGASGAPDILRLIDLLNGAASFEPWIGVSLDPSPCG